MFEQWQNRVLQLGIECMLELSVVSHIMSCEKINLS